MRGYNDYKALPIDWKVRYKVDKVEDAPSYAWVRGMAYTYTPFDIAIFSSLKEWKEHLSIVNAIIIQDNFADWNMPKGLPQVIEVDPSTLKEINTEYIICAAIWYPDETEHPRGFVAQNIDRGTIIGQYRHPNVIHIRSTKDCDDKCVQGFLTSEGNFYDREQAMCVAWGARQVPVTKAFRNEDMETFERVKEKELLESEPQNIRHPHSQFRILYSEDIY